MAQKALAEKDAFAEELKQLKQQDMGGMKLAEVEGAPPDLLILATPVTPDHSQPCIALSFHRV